MLSKGMLTTVIVLLGMLATDYVFAVKHVKSSNKARVQHAHQLKTKKYTNTVAVSKSKPKHKQSTVHKLKHHSAKSKVALSSLKSFAGNSRPNQYADDGDMQVSETAHKSLAKVAKVMQTMRYTRYKFGGTYFNLDKGIYQVDCSHYIDNIVSTTNPKAFATLRNYSRSTFPVTRDYYHFFDALPYGSVTRSWYHIRQAQQLMPGDIIVYQYRHRNKSGHVMMVTSTPEAIGTDPSVFKLQVSDSASSGHSNDTRGYGSGVGVGTLYVKVNLLTGEPYQYAWKQGAHWENGITIAMGRPVA